jgi:LmbE family N-acetylglucosaminyl deacetylase
MVIPITSESNWLPMLEALPPWQPPMVPTLVVSPHPDDETLSVGGLISFLRRNRVDVSVVAVTDGENAYEGEADLGAVREKEQVCALARLGVNAEKVVRLRMTDSGLYRSEADLTDALRRLVPPGGHIVAPWAGDFHPDHEVCGRAARVAADAVGATLSYYFFWTWHRGTPSTLKGLDLAIFSMDALSQQDKQQALLCHSSQLQHASGQPILPPSLLEPMRRSYEVFLTV